MRLGVFNITYLGKITREKMNDENRCTTSFKIESYGINFRENSQKLKKNVGNIAKFMSN